jgi:hypothetical protein
MNTLLVLQFTGGLLNLLAKNSLKNNKVIGWYFQGIGTLAYFFVFLIIKDTLYQVFGAGLVFLSVYGAYKFHKQIDENTRVDDYIRYVTLAFMLILLVLKIKINPQDYLAITQMVAATCLILGLRYLTVKDIKGWVLIIIASLLLVVIYYITELWIMMIFQIISTYISIIGYLKYKKALSLL